MRKPIRDCLVGFCWLEGGCILWFLFFFADLFGSEGYFLLYLALSKILPFENKRKIDFFFVFCSLNRIFAVDYC